MPYNPKSLANLGKRKTKSKRKNFSLTQESCDWLEKQPNQSEAIDNLIKEKIMLYTIRNILANSDHYQDQVTVKAESFLEAAAIACKVWGWDAPIDFVGSDSVYTLLSDSPGGNAIGRVYWLE